MTRDDIIAWILVQEGGYANVADDPGGATNFGITQRYLDAARSRWADLALPASVVDLTRDQAAELYRRDQWADVQGDALPAGLALLTMDSAVNEGPGTAIRLLQQAAGTTPDGIIGIGTLTAVRGSGPALAGEFAARRAVHYAQLNATEGKFELGWMRRLIAGYTKAIE